MAGLDPRLSGSCVAPVELSWRESKGFGGGTCFTQSRDVFSMHEIGAHESNEFEEAVLYFGDCRAVGCSSRKAISATAI